MNLAEDGVEIIEGVLTSVETDELIAQLPDSVAGQRNLLQACPAVLKIAHAPCIKSLLERAGCAEARPVRALFFDKNPVHNWKVPWHQDLAIAVKSRVETPGYRGWSTKDGVPHVQPPAELLSRMVTIRLHLDDCRDDDGPLRVILGSHRHGRLGATALVQLSRSRELACCVRRGGAIVMRPLILHASSPASTPSHRRVVHLEFSPDNLPGNLEWFENEPVLPDMIPL